MAEQPASDSSQQYPGTDLAYAIAIESYTRAESRWDAVHQRVDTLLALVTTVTVAAPIVATALLKSPEFTSPLLIAAGGVYLAILLGAVTVRSAGSLRQLSPQLLYEGWLHLDEGEFKRRLIYWAGIHADDARKKTYLKAFAATLLAVLFLMEIGLFLAWLSQQG